LFHSARAAQGVTGKTITRPRAPVGATLFLDFVGIVPVWASHKSESNFFGVGINFRQSQKTVFTFTFDAESFVRKATVDKDRLGSIHNIGNDRQL
jgi:hypothetical protein